jgi:hypothetical protein
MIGLTACSASVRLDVFWRHVILPCIGMLLRVILKIVMYGVLCILGAVLIFLLRPLWWILKAMFRSERRTAAPQP